jgi:adenosylhomocysteine nucleosidase
MIANRRVQFVMAVEAALSTGIALAELHRRGELPDLVVSRGSAGSRICMLGEVYKL